MLHISFEDSITNVPLDVIKAMLAVAPHLVIHKKNGYSIIDVILISLCDLMRSKKRFFTSENEFKIRFQVIHLILLKSMSYHEHSIVTKKTIEYLIHVVCLWNRDRDLDLGYIRIRRVDVASIKFILSIMDLILHIHYSRRCRSSRDRPFNNFLHRLIDIREDYSYPPKLFELALEIVGAPGCFEYDDLGRTVLVAIILSMTQSSHSRIHMKMIKNVLKKCRGISIYPYKDGRLPIHLMIYCGSEWTNGISLLATDAPKSLRRKDPTTSLLPFMLASSRGANLNTVYMLLYHDPSIFVELCNCN